MRQYIFSMIPCHLVLSTLGALQRLYSPALSTVCFLPSHLLAPPASFQLLHVSCISSIRFLLGRPLLLLPSPYASTIPFPSPSDRITCPKNHSFLLGAVC